MMLEITVVTSVTATHSDIVPASSAATTSVGPRTSFHTRRNREGVSTGAVMIWPVEGSCVREGGKGDEQGLSEGGECLEDFVDALVVLRQLALVDETGAFESRVELGGRGRRERPWRGPSAPPRRSCRRT